MRRHLIMVMAAALLLGALPAAADHGLPHPVFTQRSVYFKCTTNAPAPFNKAQNANVPISWGSTPPAASVQEGAGCGFLDAGAPTSDVTGALDPTYAGDTTGNVRSMTVDLYIFPHTNWTPVWGTALVRVDLSIDGEQVMSGDHEMDIEETNSGATQRVRFSVTGLDGKWVAHEEGAGTAVHAVELTVTHLDETEIGTWAWDTTEVPAGIVFNGPLADYRIPA